MEYICFHAMDVTADVDIEVLGVAHHSHLTYGLRGVKWPSSREDFSECIRLMVSPFTHNQYVFNGKNGG